MMPYADVHFLCISWLNTFLLRHTIEAIIIRKF